MSALVLGTTERPYFPCFEWLIVTIGVCNFVRVWRAGVVSGGNIYGPTQQRMVPGDDRGFIGRTVGMSSRLSGKEPGGNSRRRLIRSQSVL